MDEPLPRIPAIKCPFCGIKFSAPWEKTQEWVEGERKYLLQRGCCPDCGRHHLILVGWSGLAEIDVALQLWPRNTGRSPCPPEVPKEIAEDYLEACLVLQDSPKASAALSRRCLQGLLRDKAGVKLDDLAKGIQQILDDGKLPSGLADAIDAVRNIGNFAAHPMKSQTTGMILPVEPEEAAWNLDVLEQLFDFYYVLPAVSARKKAALNKKLQDAGKPPMKYLDP